MNKTKVIFLLGATGSGKTSFAVKLAKLFDGEIISADSVQVFKEFDIGSAKVTEEEKQGVKHYGIDIKSPNENFSAGEYVAYTKDCIKQIAKKNKLPIIAGGTGLYVKALTEGYNFGDAEKDENFRKEIEKQIEQFGLEKVLNDNKQVLDNLNESDRQNKVRVIRALEIAKFGGDKNKNNTPEFDFKILALSLPREVLYQKINKRVDLMINQGLIEEVQTLYEKYGSCQPMTAIGYKEVLPYLNGEVSIEQMSEKIKQNTRHYAKRQLTFLRGIQNVEYVDLNDEQCFEKTKESIKQWLCK